MRTFRQTLALFVFCAFVVLVIRQSAFAEPEKLNGKQLFALKVRPILAEKCLACHGKTPDRIESGLNLTTREGMLKGGEVSDEVLVPNDASKSLLYIATTWEDPTCEMPPKENDRLTKEQTWHIRDWINAGAPWPSEEEIAKILKAHQANRADLMTVKTSGGLSADWDNRPYKKDDLWAYQPIVRPEIPGDADNPIDAFINAKLQEKGLSPAGFAEPRTLLRRVTYDLTGLPPTPKDVQTFETFDEKTYATIIENLLASPRYGEQWGRHWLDVTRYADTSGFSRDDPRPQAWRYRDYVIRSFNHDKPFDRFLVEQIAGDELDENDPENLIAVGYLRMGPWEHTGMSVAAVTRQQYLDDVTNAIGETFLGQVLRCAKCHDHKFDPIPTRDYYSLMANLAPVQLAERTVPYLEEENTSRLNDIGDRYRKLVAQTQKETSAIDRKNRLAQIEWLKERGIKATLKTLNATIKKLPEDQRPPRDVGLSFTDLGVRKVLKKRQEYFQRMALTEKPYAFSVYSGPPRLYSSNRPMMAMPQNRKGDAESIHILTGGSIETPADQVTPGMLSATFHIAASNSPSEFQPFPTSTEGRRLALARWMVAPENPLTARVIVNRIWQHHFGGRGIVETANNFGIMGKRPTHPELLDFLARWFVENGWSIKKLHRLILTSETYRRSSHPNDVEAIAKHDPENLLLSYYPPRRLAAEEIRDSLLAVSGELNLTMGGPGVFPDIHREVAMQPIHVMGSVSPAWQPSLRPEERNRRTIYAYRQRNRGFPQLEAFNLPGSDASCERRDQTTVTPQALSLLNSRSSLARAIAMANRIRKIAKTPREQIRQAFLLAYLREPTQEQYQRSLAHLAKMTPYHQAHPPKTTELPTEVDRHMVEEMTGEKFHWTEKLDVYADPQFVPDLGPADVDAHTRALAELCLVLMNSNEFLHIY